jgi:1-acyl-sn-glycerol-3-phosphate acyltransferase
MRRITVSPVLKGLLSALCKIDIHEYLAALDEQKAKYGNDCFIIAINHINFLEVPILVAFSHPRKVTGLVQQKAWGNPVMAFIFNTYDAIPLNREGAYLHTFRNVQDILKAGFHVCIAPEGTRSSTGILAQGKEGIVQLAYITGAPVLPIGHFGGQSFWENFKHFRKTPFTMKAGKPFHFKFDKDEAGKRKKPSRETMSTMTEELMGQIARLLPEQMRGFYAEEALKVPQHLDFLE